MTIIVNSDIFVRLLPDSEVTNDLFIKFCHYFQNVLVILLDYIFSIKKKRHSNCRKKLLILLAKLLDSFTRPSPTFTRKYEQMCVNFEP